jgi:phosphoribosyl 1,2-cyclic phosphodiesterase
MEFGGNTSCVLVTFDSGQKAILDAGSGLRKLGEELLAAPLEQSSLPIILSHTHWDHIQGFPFFGPAYVDSFTIDIFLSSIHRPDRNLQQVFSNQMGFEYFPVGLQKLRAQLRFQQPHQESATTEWGVRVTACPLNHPGQSYGYRFEQQGKILVYCTDVEHGEDIDAKVVELARNADLLIHDAQYTPEELPRHRGWGHSSWQQAITVARLGNVKKLALFHHDPRHDDAFLAKVEQQCQQQFAGCFLAREGMEVAF